MIGAESDLAVLYSDEPFLEGIGLALIANMAVTWITALHSKWVSSLGIQGCKGICRAAIYLEEVEFAQEVGAVVCFRESPFHSIGLTSARQQSHAES